MNDACAAKLRIELLHLLLHPCGSETRVSWSASMLA